MKRLIDDESRAGSPESFLTELVRATPPFESAPLERQRVFALVAGSARRPARFSFRVGSGVLLLSGAAAAAVIGHSWAPARHPVTAVASVASPHAVPVRSVDAPDVPAAGEASDAPPIAARAPIDAPSTKLRTTGRMGSKPLAKGGEDPAPVLEAIRALRTDGDPVRAEALLADYLKAHPHSVLSEDALALSIESAVTRRDSRAAADLGRRYLAQFPNGRYRAFALRAVQ